VAVQQKQGHEPSQSLWGSMVATARSFFGPSPSPRLFGAMGLYSFMLGLVVMCAQAGEHHDGSVFSEEQSTLLCKAGLECSPQPFMGHPANGTRKHTYPSVHNKTLEGLLDTLKARFAAKVASGIRPLVVHVGPNDLLEEVAMYRELMPWHPTTVIDEPNPSVHSQLKENLEKAGASNASIITAALCDKDASGLMMHAFSDRRFDDVTCVDSDALKQMSYWTSLDREVALLPLERLRYASNCSDAEWTRLESYLEEIPVKCMSVASLLEEVHGTSGSVDMLTIDAEGFDLAVLDQFLAEADFHPAWLQFEWNLVDDLKEVWTRLAGLAKKGFELHQHRWDVVAVAKADRSKLHMDCTTTVCL